MQKTTIDEDGTIKQYRFPNDTTALTIFKLPVDRETFLTSLRILMRNQNHGVVSQSHFHFVIVRDFERQQVTVTTNIGHVAMPMHHAMAILLESAPKTNREQTAPV